MDKSSSNTGHVVRALDPSTGEQVWETSLGWTSTPAEGGIGIDPRVIDPIGDRLIVLLSDDETYSTQAMTLSTETGAILEETTLRGQDSAPGLYLMGEVLISTDGEHASRLDPNALSAGPMWTVSGIVATDDVGDPFEGVGLLSIPTMDGDLLIDAATGEPSTVFRPPPITASIGQIGPYIIQAEHVESLWSIEAFDLEGVRLWSHSGDQFDYFLMDNGTPIIIEHRPNAIMRLDPRNGSDMWDSPLTTTGDAFAMAGLGDTIRLYDWEDGEPTTIVDVDTKEVLGSASEYLGDAAGTTTYYKDAADYSDAAESPGGLHAWDATGRSLWSIDQPADLHLVRAPGHLITYELDQTQITSWR